MVETVLNNISAAAVDDGCCDVVGEFEPVTVTANSDMASTEVTGSKFAQGGQFFDQRLPAWWRDAAEVLTNSVKENLTVKVGVEGAYGAGATAQITTNLNGEKGYEITYNKGFMMNPVGSIGGDVFSTGKIEGFFQSLEFCAVGCVSIETNYQNWAVGTSIGTAAGFNFQTGVKGGF